MKIAFFSTQSYDREYFNQYNTGHELIYFDAPLNANTVSLAGGSEAVCVFVNDDLGRDVLAKLAAQRTSLVALRCAGFNNVDVAAAKEYGVDVVRVPAYSPHAVAEFAVALILTLNRKTHKAYNRVREGNFSLERLTGFDLFGKTVGVIGTGKIGECFARIMQGFGCRVIAYDMFINEQLRQLGVEYKTLEALLGESHIISLHCPLTDQTRHLVNTQSLQLMRKSVMLINTSRGAIIDTRAVIDALRSGQVGYLGIDVYEQEEALFFHNLSEEVLRDDMIMMLMSFPNVLITSHQGFFTAEALEQIAKTTFQNLDLADQRHELQNRVR